MTFDEVCGFLTQRGVPFEVREIQDGRQVKAKTSQQECVNVFSTGKVVIGGKKSALRDELEAWKNSGFVPATASGDLPAVATAAGATVGLDKRVFIVYGHDHGARDSLELLLRRMGLDPIVLANLPAGGDTIIEKLEKYLGGAGNVGFACVLLTPAWCSHGSAASASRSCTRSRSNVPVTSTGSFTSRSRNVSMRRRPCSFGS